MSYPTARKSDQVDDYHGVQVADPYRWLEDPDSAESRTWIEAENRVTNAFLEKIPGRAALKKRLSELWDYEKYGLPEKEGPYYFIFRNSGLQKQGVLYKTDRPNGKREVLLDPNTLSKEGTMALQGTSISKDGRWLAYGISAAGSDWQTWKIRDTASGQDLPETLDWVKFSGVSWTADGSGFYYSRYQAPSEAERLRSQNFDQKLYYHQRGTAQSADRLIYERPDHKEWIFDGGVSEDGQYLIITITEGSEQKNRIFYLDLTGPADRIIELLPDANAQYNFMGNDGPLFYFQTNFAAPQGRIVTIDTKAHLPAQIKELVPENTDRLEGASLVGGRLIVSYLHDSQSRVAIFDTAGKPAGALTLPGIGTVAGLGGRRDATEVFYSFTSYNHPPKIYRYDFSTSQSEVIYSPKLAFDPADYETKQVFYPSADGTKIPLFITSKKGLKEDGKNPVYLYGYGGFDISLTPSFSPANLAWMEMGGVYAVANLRGGGEYGETWHQAGMVHQKQNVFDDFIAAAEYLVREKYTSSSRLAIGGRSNGGLLVAAALTQRPDLFGAALPGVGLTDMLRFQKFTIGWAWISDYGSSDRAEDFPFLYAYSPLHHIRPGTAYPPTLILTGDHDDRVVPAHSFKFAATLQAAQSGPHPILIRIDTNSGHGAGKPTTKAIEEVTDSWAFLGQALGMDLSSGH